MARDDFEFTLSYTAGERQFILYRYLLEHTGKGYTVTREDIFNYLLGFGIEISPHTLYNDFEVLRGTMKLDIQFDPHVRNRGKGGYWVKNPPFEPYELRLMVDGIQSSKFITQKKAREITNKIKDNLADIHTRATLNRQTYVSDRVRSMNDSVVEEADKLHEAIANDRKIGFYYFHYTPDKSKPKRYTKNGERHIVSPYALSWNNGNYYLYAYDGTRFRYYRVDRMERITNPLLAKRDGKEAFKVKNLTAPQAKVFEMYSGDIYTVRMRFRNELADAVVDKFGKDVMMVPTDAEHFTISESVEVSPPFYAWVAVFGRRAKILGPEPVIEGMRQFIEKVADMYKKDGEK